MRTMRHAAIAAILPLAGAALAGCTTSGAPQAPTQVVVLTHGSFAIPDDLVEAFEASSGYEVQFVASDDGGTLVNQLILTEGAPLGDAVFGIDNTFASRIADAGVLEEYTSAAPAAAEGALAAFGGGAALTPIDFSDVCLNVDLTYFAATGLDVPSTLDDLTRPEYKDLLSVTHPATSSPGLAFLLATASAKGDAWPEYWAALRGNGVRVTGSWSDTYFVDFSAPNYGGDRPIVLSYASSPPSEVIDGEPTTAALLDTCFRQVEYAGVIKGAANPAGAKAVIDWMLSDDFQSAVPESMYVYPVSSTATIPADWERFAPLASHPWPMSPEQITAIREDLIREWTTVVLD